MNTLKNDKQVAVIAALAEGNSIRSVERMTGIHRDTIMRLGVRVGEGCARLMDERMRGLDCRRLTRLTHAFSKKLQNFKAAVASNFAYHNYCLRHITLQTTPAVAAGL
jgi:malonyl CoA-acyl carrier protein transacylase